MNVFLDGYFLSSEYFQSVGLFVGFLANQILYYFFYELEKLKIIKGGLRHS